MTLRRVFVIPDCHVPYEDKLAVKVMLKALEVAKPTHLVIIGDFIDAYPLSFHEKSIVRKHTLAAELAAANALLDKIAAAAPKAEKVFMSGNHEHRLQRYLANKAPELKDLPALDLPTLLGLTRRGFKHFNYREVYRVGKCHFAHDVGRCGKGVAAQSVTDFGHNIVVGHSHRAQIYYTGNIRGESHVGMSAGWLGNYASIDYRHQSLSKREWTHGFALVDVESGGNCHMHFVPIISGKCVVDGKLVR